MSLVSWNSSVFKLQMGLHWDTLNILEILSVPEHLGYPGVYPARGDPRIVKHWGYPRILSDILVQSLLERPLVSLEYLGYSEFVSC